MKRETTWKSRPDDGDWSGLGKQGGRGKTDRSPAILVDDGQQDEQKRGEAEPVPVRVAFE